MILSHFFAEQALAALPSLKSLWIGDLVYSVREVADLLIAENSQLATSYAE